MIVLCRAATHCNTPERVSFRQLVRNVTAMHAHAAPAAASLPSLTSRFFHMCSESRNATQSVHAAVAEHTHARLPPLQPEQALPVPCTADHPRRISTS